MIAEPQHRRHQISGPVRCDDRAPTTARILAEQQQERHRFDCIAATNTMRGHMAEGGDDYRRWADHIVLVTPSLSDVSTWVEALKTSQVPDMGFVVVCPMHSWRRRRDEEDMLRLQKLPRVTSTTSKEAFRGRLCSRRWRPFPHN